MSTRTDLLTTTRNVDLKWTATVDYEAPPRYADQFPVFDDFVYAMAYETVVNDFMFTTDQASLYSGFTRAPADSVVMGESLSYIGTFVRAFADPMVVTDDVSLILGTSASVNYADAVAMTEAFGFASTMPRNLADSVVMSEAFSSTSTVALNVADGVVLTDGQSFDPYWPFVQLLVHADGPQTGNNFVFRDSSPYNKTVSIGGQLPIQGSVSPFVAPNTNNMDYTGVGGSAYFGAVGTDYLIVPQSDHFHFPPGTDFTVECWFMITADSPPDFNGDRTACLLSTFPQAGAQVQTQGWTLNVQGNGLNPTGSASIYMEILAGGGTYEIVYAPGPFPQKTWIHVAVCRAGTVTKMFINGAQMDSRTLADQDLTASGPLTIGSSYATGINRLFKGYIADVRISKGAAYYTGNFTPSTTTKTDGSGLSTAIKLEFSNAAVFDNARKNNFHMDGIYPSTASFKWGPTALLFDGAAARNLQAPYPLGTERFGPLYEDFTAECWFNLQGNASPDGDGNRQATLMSTFSNANPIEGWCWAIFGDATSTGNGFMVQSFNKADGAPDQLFGPATVSKFVWHHAAFSRVSGVMYLHYDGQLIGSLAATRPVVGEVPGYMLVGMTPYPGYTRAFPAGYIDEIRFTSGKARYGNANFAVPTAPFPNGVAQYTNTYDLRPADSVTMSEAGVFQLPATTTWDPANCSAHITLTSGNRIAGGDNTFANCRAINGKNSGKWYFEVTNQNPIAGGGGIPGIGLCAGGFNLETYLTNGGCTALLTYGELRSSANATLSSTWPVWNTTNAVLCVAVDLNARLMWARLPGGTWNASGSGADPATGVGGVSIGPNPGSGQSGVTAFIAAEPTNAGVHFLLNTGQDAFVGAIPSGFSRWG